MLPFPYFAVTNTRFPIVPGPAARRLYIAPAMHEACRLGCDSLHAGTHLVSGCASRERLNWKWPRPPPRRRLPEVLELLDSAQAGVNDLDEARERCSASRLTAEAQHPLQRGAVCLTLDATLTASRYVLALSQGGHTPLHFAAGFGHVSIVTELLKRNCALEIRDSVRSPGLHADNVHCDRKHDVQSPPASVFDAC